MLTVARQLAVIVASLTILAASAPAQPPRDTRPLGVSASTPNGIARSDSAPRGAGTARTIGSLALVLGLVLVGAAVVRRLAAKNPSLGAALGASGRSPAGILEVLGRYPLGRGNSLVLLRLDRRVLLLSQTIGAAGRGLMRPGAASLNTLSEITDGDEVASILAKVREAEGDTMTARFQSLLNTFAKTTDEPELSEAQSPETEKPTVVVRSGSWAGAAGSAA